MSRKVFHYVVSLILALAVSSAGFTSVFAAPPGNDNFADATIINALPFNDIVDTTNATTELNEPQYCVTSSLTVWYLFTPERSALIKADMTDSDFNTNVSIYQAAGGGFDGLSFIGCATGGYDFIVHKGATYYIQVGSNDTGELHFNLQELQELSGPINNDFVNATAIVPPLPFDDTVDAIDASLETGEPNSSCAWYGSLWKTVWYAYTPSTNGVVSASIPGASFAPVLAAYTGNSLTDLIELGCQAFIGNLLTFPVEARTTYYFQLGKLTSWDPDGEVQFRIDEVLPPSNDKFGNAAVVNMLPFSDVVNNADATLEPDEPQSCEYSPKTVWYSFTPTTNMLVEANMLGSSFNDTIFSIYKAEGPGFTFTYITCGAWGNTATFSAQADATYYIQVGSINSGGGELHLNLQEVPPPPNDDFINALVISSSLPFDDTVNIAGATLEADEPNSWCAWYGSLWKTVWYAYTPSTNGVVSANIPGAVFAPVLAVYTGNSLTDLTQLDCRVFSGNALTLSVNAGTTYYFQVGRLTSWDPDGEVIFNIEEQVNQPPVANAGGPYTANEGDSITLDASNSYDPEGGILTYEWDLDADGEYDDAVGVTSQSSFADDGTYTVGLRVTNSHGLSGTSTATVTVYNVAPTVGAITAPILPIKVNTTINPSFSFTDPGVLDTHVAYWYWGYGSLSAGVVTEANGSGIVDGSHTYTTPGVYTLYVELADDDWYYGVNWFQYVVVYDPTGGFVTGTGWINSPAGAYAADATLVGRATFGFVSKYQMGANVPTGNTEFQFHAANMNFKSTSYDWLVVAGSKAQYKGTGTINGKGEYKFILTAIDGSPDMFRIKIWDKSTGQVIYDNQRGAGDNSSDATELGGGSIVIHK